MAEQAPDTPRKKRDLLSVLGMVAVAGAAAFTSYSGLSGLAELAGWPSKLALMLPVTIDAYAMTATRVWLSPARLTKKARAWARNNAIGAISMSVLGNTIYHAAAAHVLEVTWPVVVGISAIPSIVLGLTVHLWHVADDLEPEPAPKPSPGPAIAEPEQVRAAYPILGNAGALPKQTPSALGAGKPSAPRIEASAPGPAIASAPAPRPKGAASAPGGAGTSLVRGPQSPTAPQGREERFEQLLHAAQMLDVSSVIRGDGPMSARGLARELHISQDTARALIKEMQRRMDAVDASDSRQRDTGPRTDGALRAPGEVRAQPVPPTPSGAPASTAASAPGLTASAPDSTTGSARANASLASEPSAPDAVPAQRPAPVEHANGSRVEQS